MGKRNELVVKSNRLIEASYRLSLIEQRIILLAIVYARKTGRGLNALDFVPVTAKDYAEQFCVDERNAYLQIKEAGITLYKRGFVLHDTDPESGKPRVINARWISAASYIDGAGTIQICFSPQIVPYITRLEAEFTRYKLEKVAQMSSPYAIRLYELLMQWGSVGKREIKLEWLKKSLMLEKDYPRLFDFKKRVVDVAVAQINAQSDLTVSYTQRKTGRTVSHLIFTFAPEEPPTQSPAEETPAKAQAERSQARSKSPTQRIRESELFRRLRAIGIGERLAISWIKQDEARARAALAYTEQRAQQGRIKGSPAGYLRRVFEEGSEIDPSPPPPPKLTRKEIERQARPGESWEEAEARIVREP